MASYCPARNTDDTIFNITNYRYNCSGGGGIGETGAIGPTGMIGHTGSTGPTGMMGATGAVIYPLVGQQMVRLEDNNGYGSINTGVRRFLTTVVNVGTDITYTDSATLGASFTINTSGVYGISYSDNFPNIGDLYITRNATSFNFLPAPPINEILAEQVCQANERANVAVCVYLNAGDVIRAQQTNVNSPSTFDFTFFCITRTDAGGSKGDTGSTGQIGNTGPIGATGLPGTATNTGATGPIGATGPSPSISTTAGDVGTYSYCYCNTGPILFGQSVSGGNLQPCESPTTLVLGNPGSLSGTWRCMGGIGGGNGGSLFLRIS